MFGELWQNLVTRFRKCLDLKSDTLNLEQEQKQEKEKKIVIQHEDEDVDTQEDDVDREYYLLTPEERKVRDFTRDLARALDGDAASMYEVSGYYTSGHGVPENQAEALRWLELAAEGGCDRAQNQLGLRYLHGWDVPQNFKLALKYLTAASRSLDYCDMNVYVGTMYLNGVGCKRDLQLAAKYFGDFNYNHAPKVYRQGLEHEKLGQYEEAKKSYLFAIRCGNRDAAINLERMIRQGVVRLQSPEFTDGWSNFCNMQPY